MKKVYITDIIARWTTFLTIYNMVTLYPIFAAQCVSDRQIFRFSRCFRSIGPEFDGNWGPTGKCALIKLFVLLLYKCATSGVSVAFPRSAPFLLLYWSSAHGGYLSYTATQVLLRGSKTKKDTKKLDITDIIARWATYLTIYNMVVFGDPFVSQCQ